MHEAGNDLQLGTARYKGANQLAYMENLKDRLKTFQGQYWGTFWWSWGGMWVGHRPPSPLLPDC